MFRGHVILRIIEDSNLLNICKKVKVKVIVSKVRKKSTKVILMLVIRLIIILVVLVSYLYKVFSVGISLKILVILNKLDEKIIRQVTN